MKKLRKYIERWINGENDHIRTKMIDEINKMD